VSDSQPDKNYANLQKELRSGVIILAVLGQLRREYYGYQLIKSLAEQGLAIDQGTLYPLLRRLESAGLLQSEWRVEDSRPHRWYHISPAGEQLLAQLTTDWLTLVAAMQRILK